MVNNCIFYLGLLRQDMAMRSRRRCARAHGRRGPWLGLASWTCDGVAWPNCVGPAVVGLAGMVGVELVGQGGTARLWRHQKATDRLEEVVERLWRV